jgi:phage baseplate assembly protein W
MSSSAKLYDKIVLTPSARNQDIPGPKTYKGFSTVNGQTENFSLFDLELIKQDILNHFHTRQGERLMNPTFGTVIWDILFEPLTEDLKAAVAKNVQDIINYDPRVKADQVTITSYESGIQIECVLTYLPYNISQSMQLRFDQANGLLGK